jgi:branched-chain amino acid transport system permease protein
VNLAHGALTVLAAYLGYVVVDALGLNPLVALVVVVPAMFALGYAVQRGLVNLTLGTGILPPLMVTFGLAIVLENSLLEVFSADSRGLDAGRIEDTSVRIAERLAIGWLPLLIFLLAVAVLVSLQLLLDRTSFGRALRATSDDQQAAQLMGINNRHLYAMAMGIALAIAGVAGVFQGIRTTFGPLDGPFLLIFAFEAVIIGGLGSLWGTLVGGIVLGVAQTVGAQVEPGWFQLTGHIVFLAVLAIRPTGLFARQGALT